MDPTGSKAAPPKFYVYAVIASSITPPLLLSVHNTRAEAREAARALDLPALRIRRAKLTLFES